MRGIGYNHEIWNTRSTVLYDKLYLQRKDYLPPTPNTEFICIISLYGSITNRQITCNLKVPTSSFQLHTSISPYQFQTLPISPQPSLSRHVTKFEERIERRKKEKKKKIAKNNKNWNKKNHDSIVLSLLDRRTYKYIYTYHSIVTRERQGLTNYRYEVGARLWKIVEFLEGRGPFVGFSLVGALYAHSRLTLLSLGYLLTYVQRAICVFRDVSCS